MFYRSHCSCFLPISWAIAHNFRFLGQFPATVNTDTSFERRRKTRVFHVSSLHFCGLELIVSLFLPISWATTHIFWFPGWFLATVTIDTWFEGHRKNSWFSCFLSWFSWAIAHSFHVFAHFMGYSAYFPVPGMISCYRTCRYMFWEASQKYVFFMFCASISMGYSSQFSCFWPFHGL
jgi:hypothetical protein